MCRSSLAATRSSLIESALFGTSLGVDLKSGDQVEGGHRASPANFINAGTSGSIEKTIEESDCCAGMPMKPTSTMYMITVRLGCGMTVPCGRDLSDIQRLSDRCVKKFRISLRDGDYDRFDAACHCYRQSVTGPCTASSLTSNQSVVTNSPTVTVSRQPGLVTDAELFLRELLEAVED